MNTSRGTEKKFYQFVAAALLLIAASAGIWTWRFYEAEARIIYGSSQALGIGVVRSTHILDGEIVNADVNASAAIVWTKIDKAGSKLSDIANPDLASASGTLAIANGGTGTTTAANAINALLPDQTGNSGKFLTTNGATSTWDTVGQPADVTIYATSTTWTKATGAKVVKVIVTGAGGGGGGGGGGNVSDNAEGGTGGGGGARWTQTFDATDLTATTTITIGWGGDGGPGGANGAGTVGSVGGNSSFGSYLTTYGGGGGAASIGGTAAAGAAPVSGTGGVVASSSATFFLQQNKSASICPLDSSASCNLVWRSVNINLRIVSSSSSAEK